MLKESLKRMMYYFGYIKHPESRDEDATAFFEIGEGEQHDEKLLKTFCSFRQDNEDTIKFLSQHTHEEIGKMYDMCMKKPPHEECDICSTDFSKEVSTPSAVDYYTK